MIGANLVREASTIRLAGNYLAVEIGGVTNAARLISDRLPPIQVLTPSAELATLADASAASAGPVRRSPGAAW